MLTYTFEKSGGVSLYEQLYRSLAAEMRAGTLTAGTRSGFTVFVHKGEEGSNQVGGAGGGGEAAQQADAGGPSGGQRYHGEKRL